MKEKWIEEKFPRWFIFGEGKDKDVCDVSDTNGDIICGVTHAQATVLIAERNKIVDALILALSSIPNEDERYRVLESLSA